MPIDLSTPVGQVRALIPDVEEVSNPNRPLSAPEYMFDDDHLSTLIDINGGSIRLAAADACEVLGTSEAIIAKVIKTEDIQSDGAKVMGQFLARAKQLRAFALSQANGDEVDGFDIVPFAVPRSNSAYWIG